MTALGSRIGAAWRALKSAGSPYSDLIELLKSYDVNETRSGTRVDPHTALQHSTVLGIVRVLGDGMGQSPLKIYRPSSDGKGVEPATDHPLYELLYRTPNNWQSSFSFRETLVLHLELTGNFFAFLNRVGRAGTIKEIWPVESSRIEVYRWPDMTLQYFVTGYDGERREMPPGSIWHIRGPSWSSWLGMEPVRLAREAIGLSMAIEHDQAALYKNGLRTSGTYSVDGNLSPEKYVELSAWIQKHTQEKPNAPLVLDRAAKYMSNTMSGVDAQTIDSRKFQVEDICRAFRVIPMMVGHSDKTATYASAEQMFIAHAVHTLAPRFERVEQSIYQQLLTPADRAAGYYAKFNMNSLLRGAVQDQAAFFSAALGAGGSPAWMTQNEVRALLELNPLEGGDALPKPAAHTPATPNPAAPTSGGKNGSV